MVYSFRIIDSQASYQNHDGPYMLKCGQELGQAASDEYPKLLHVQVLQSLSEDWRNLFFDRFFYIS